MWKNLILCGSLYFICCSAFSNTIIIENNAKTNIGVAHPTYWSPFENAATLANVSTFEGSLLFQNRFNVKEISTKSVQTALHTSPVNIGIAFSSFGFSNYNENIASISFARKFSKKFMLGLSFDYYFIYFSKNEGYKGKLLPQIGLLSQLSEKLYIGFQAFNPTQAIIKTSYFDKEIPSIFSLATNYYFAKNLLGGIELDKEIRSDVRIAAGFEYQIVDMLLLKLGCSHYKNFIPNIGVGLKIGGFDLQTNFNIHATLGITSSIALTYKMK